MTYQRSVQRHSFILQVCIYSYFTRSIHDTNEMIFLQFIIVALLYQVQTFTSRAYLPSPNSILN